MATPTPTPTLSVTPSVSPGCFNYNFSLQSIYFLTNAGPFDLSGVTSNGTTILIQTGVTLNQLTTGFTTTICSPITGGTVQSTGVCNSSFDFFIETILASPTPTPTPTPTSTPSITNSITPTPTNTVTPSVTSSQIINPTPSVSSTPSSTPPLVNDYYYQPNSWAPPIVNQGAGDNYLSTSNALSTEIGTNVIDYTTTDWSYSLWGYPQFEYTSLPTANDTYVSTLVSICVPGISSPPYPDTSLTNLTIAVEYTSGATLVNDLVVYILDDLGRTAKWTWAINSDPNDSITGINNSKMWDSVNFGSTLNGDRFSNIVITHDDSLVVGSASGSTKAYWNGSLLELKSYEQPDVYPHISDYNSLTESKFYIAQGSLMGNTTSFHPLSTNIDNPIYFPSTILTLSNAATIYNNGVVQDTITTAVTDAYMWNFDNVSLSHLECIDQTNTQVPSLTLSQNSGGGGTQTYIPI